MTGLSRSILRAALLTIGLLSLAACVAPSAPVDPTFALNGLAPPSNL